MSEKSRYPLFERVLLQKGIPRFQRGYHIEIPAYLNNYNLYGLPKNHWRIDYCWPEYRLAVEIDGGAFLDRGGGHNRGAGFRKDVIRHNTLREMGFFLLRFMPEHLPLTSTYAIDCIENFFRNERKIRSLNGYKSC